MRTSATSEHSATRKALIALCLVIMIVLYFAPLGVLFTEAFRKGVPPFLEALSSDETLSAVSMTLAAAAIAVPINALAGLAAAWAIAKFRGKQFLITLIDLPFSVSPVVAGLAYVLLFSERGFFGPVLTGLGWQVIFALPGIALATTFVTFPFVARELIPLMQKQGSADEEAALTLGASPLRMFLTVTLPNIKWGLLAGVLLCNARAMGEFGAVTVVSGHIRGETNTLPLHIDALYGGFDLVGAFSVATLLALLAVVTLAVKAALEWRRGESNPH
jgi:sulfate transport system permease protein